MEHLIRVKLKIDSLPFHSYDLPLSMERSIGDCRHTVSLVLAAAFDPSQHIVPHLAENGPRRLACVGCDAVSVKKVFRMICTFMSLDENRESRKNKWLRWYFLYSPMSEIVMHLQGEVILVIFDLLMLTLMR